MSEELKALEAKVDALGTTIANAVSSAFESKFAPVVDAIGGIGVQVSAALNDDRKDAYSDRDKARADSDAAKAAVKEVDDLKAALAASQAENGKIESRSAMRGKLFDTLKAQGVVDADAASQLHGINAEYLDGLKVLEDGSIEGVTELVEKIKTAHPYLVKEVEVPPESTSPYQTISQVPTATRSGSKPINDDAIRENFVKDPHSVINSLLSGK